jgi:hypothetical protein
MPKRLFTSKFAKISACYENVAKRLFLLQKLQKISTWYENA